MSMVSSDHSSSISSRAMLILRALGVGPPQRVIIGRLTGSGPDRPTGSGTSTHKGFLENVVAGRGDGAFVVTALGKHGFQVGQQPWTAAEHQAVDLRVQRRHAEVGE